MKFCNVHRVLFITLFLIGQATFAQFSQTIHLNYANAEKVRKALLKVIAYSQQVFGGGGYSGNVGDYVEGAITSGSGNGLTFQDITVELIDISGDTISGSARLYIFTSQRDREVTLSKGNSDLVDNYRVRVDRIDPRRQKADITIRQVGNGVANVGRGQHPPGRVIVTADQSRALVTITADYQSDLQNLVGWVMLWDQPKNQDYTDYNYQPPAYLLQPNQSISTVIQKR